MVLSRTISLYSTDDQHSTTPHLTSLLLCPTAQHFQPSSTLSLLTVTSVSVSVRWFVCFGQSFADFSQEIGLASIGATDDQITRLSRCYWSIQQHTYHSSPPIVLTLSHIPPSHSLSSICPSLCLLCMADRFSVEFGLCKQQGQRKAYGAGLLSSFGELEYAMSDKPDIRPFDPFDAAEREYPITEYQPVYYEADSFEDAQRRMREYSESFGRLFYVRYNPYSQSLEVDGNVITDGDRQTTRK